MKTYTSYIIVIIIMLLFACNTVQKRENSQEKKRNTEARTNSKKMLDAQKKQIQFTNKISADVETPPVTSKPGADAADDPAIWVNKNKPEQSLIIGTNKKAGLYVYNLDGEETQFVQCGKVNNVDLRDGFRYKNKEVVLVAASNRSLNTISVFYLDKETLKLSDFILNIPSKVNKVYGFCMHKDKSNNFYLIVNGKDGNIEIYLLQTDNDKIDYKLVSSAKVNSQPEGMVVDDETGTLYIGVEEEAIFYMNIHTNNNGEFTKIENTSSKNKYIEYDIEGLALFKHNEKKYLIASIQGNFSYAIYDISDTVEKPIYVTSFVIVDNVIDGVEETDGLDVVAYHLNDKFSEGLLVVQDGFNKNGKQSENQNFKYVNLKKILELIK